MGLRERWMQWTEPRVKEITPQDRCRWFERSRPRTATGKRSKNSTGPQPAEASQTVDISDDKSSIFKRRGFSIPKRKTEKWYQDPASTSAQEPASTHELPRVPDSELERSHVTIAQHRANGGSATRSPTATKLDSPEGRALAEFTAVAEATHGWGMLPGQHDVEVPIDTPHEQSGGLESDSKHPETAVPTQESILDGIFELPANTPRSSNFPSTAHHNTVSKSRKRSKSSASDISLHKRASWFTIGRRKGDLPPLPDTDIARPTTAPKQEQAFIAELPTFDSLPKSPSPTVQRESEEAESLLRAFPSVPDLRSHDDKTFDLNESRTTSSSKHTSMKSVDFHKPLSTSKSFSQPRLPMLLPDSVPRPPSNVSDAFSSDQRRVSIAMSARSSNGSRLSRYEQRSVRRVTRFMELMDNKSRSSIYSVVSEVEPKKGELISPQGGQLEETFRNEDALAALEFGIAEVKPDMPQPLRIDKTRMDT